MRKASFALALVFLPSVVTAMPTIALFPDADEDRVSIRSREAITLSAHETYWWFGELDLFRAICQYSMPPHSTICGKPDIWAGCTISLDTGSSCLLGNAPDSTSRRDLFEMVVLGLESEHQRGIGLFWTETIACAGQSIPLPLARSTLITH